MQPGMSISYVARRHGLSPSLVFRWRRLMSEGGKEAIHADEDVVPASEARKLAERVRELERLLGRKATLASILRKARHGVRLNEHLEHPDGAAVFQHSCEMGLEGIVSKRLGSRYRSGRSTDWLKFKNPDAPAMKREAEEEWGR
jgi:transposase-like protein